MKGELTWVELSAGAFKKNISAIRKLVGKNILLAPCVKANAYGHGLLECAKIFCANGADWLCVDSVDEAILLRKNGIKIPMLIMGYVGPKDMPKVAQYNVRVFIYDYRDAKALSAAAQKLHTRAFAHVKVDTGMNRQGVPLNDLRRFLIRVKKLRGLQVEAVATHFATSDEFAVEKREFYVAQKEKFSRAILIANSILGKNFLLHCANSGALLSDPESYFDLVRPGLAMYGYYPSQSIRQFCLRRDIILSPVLSLFTTIAQIKNLEKGECVSYGCEFRAPKKMKVAVLPVGYYDGIRRDLTNRGFVLIHGKPARILGRVCMNIMMVDISKIPEARPGNRVTLIGRDRSRSITAEDIAKTLGTIHYEVLTQLRESIAKFLVR